MNLKVQRFNLKQFGAAFLLTGMLFIFAKEGLISKVSADTAATNSTTASTTASTTTNSNAASAAADKAQLQKQLNDIESLIAGFEQQLNETRSKKNTLNNKVRSLKIEQQKLTLQIQSTNLLIQNLEGNIVDTQSSIEAAQKKGEVLKTDISGTLLNLYESDGQAVVSSLASQGGLTDFFQEVDNNEKLSSDLSANVDLMRKLKADLEAKSVQLEEQKQGAQNLLSIKGLQSVDLSSKVGEQSTLLNDTKGKEAQYASMLNDTKKRAAQIRSQMYDLSGSTKQVTFGEAVDIATRVSKQTGVRTAFLLAILKQESNLGKNVGTCNRPGDPESKSWKAIMKPDRDQQPFQVITSELGLDPDTTAVSCPMVSRRGMRIGWGGGMGPAQFIASTWVSHSAEVSAISGHPANPWNINDAFIASALLLKANGGIGSKKDEWNAAMRYFSGSTNRRFRFYGDNVLALAQKYQSEIDSLGQ
ncbi:MAG: hypothetical protein NVSMB66_4260 [Candidatus Doudnabacteria bacterium]